MMSSERLIPVDGCWVQLRDQDSKRVGRVIGERQTGGRIELRVSWGRSREEWVPLEELCCGLQLGWTVQDIPLSTTRTTLGQGTIVGRRKLGGHEQILVQLDDDGRSLWLPYENLRRIKDVRLRYQRRQTGSHDHADRFRLKLLAHALENWNHLTGSLDRLDVDPLPHQIQLVHRILSSGHYNWLIADDVGLGKTIEVGLLLAALKRKGQARRVLIISPAGLTRQWQDELQFKFDQQYQIYGRDFEINNPLHWKLYDHVIASIDLAKRDDRMQTLQQADNWDVVIFDEGHKLTRYSSGERAQRYRLAESLRPNADAFLLLSGTPHQGYTDRFMALLELIRPDLKPQIHTIESNPEVVGEMILRNRKSEVTDSEGNFIFKGQQVHRVPVDPSADTLEFQKRLKVYLTRGYNAGAQAGRIGRAIGFVMTTYRKLASSSIAAIEFALERRRARLIGENGDASSQDTENLSLEDLTEGGDDQDDLAESIASPIANEFFSYEIEFIDELLSYAEKARTNDEKLRIFLDQVVSPLDQEGKKLLVFTEYRATQSYLKQALEEAFNDPGGVLLINGSMDLDAKLQTIEAFNEGDNRFLISTEAGGEGLNLHRACHVMVNYDLPWNPARLVQRIGRLYRYGQEETVVVFNLHARDSFDNAAIDLMMSRVSEIVAHMSPVGSEFNDRFYAEILGDVLEHIDLAQILQSTTNMEMERTKEEIDQALERAQQARQLQEEILSHVSGYDPNALEGTLGFTLEHVNSFVRGMLPYLGISIEEELHDGRLFEIRLAPDLRGKFPEFLQRTVVRVTTDRRLASRLKDVVLLDFEASFFQYLLELAKSQNFDGLYSCIGFPLAPEGMLVAFKLRWQNDQGEAVMEEMVSYYQDSDESIKTNPTFLRQLLVSRLESLSPPPSSPAEERQQRLETLVGQAHKRLEMDSTRFKHPNGLVTLAAADFKESTS